MNIYDKAGKPISMQQWGQLHGDGDYYRVAEDHVGEVRISTVWLGLDHAFFGGPPLIFETMVFDSPENFQDLICARYTTEDEAKVGHMAVVERLRSFEEEP